ncbi:MAG: phosphate ABC transporter substrate-binding protein [Sulfuricurvum sp.]|nr:phosphate ABC transporter substrate-binding protein [Sulfuricurvum sp.]
MAFSGATTIQPIIEYIAPYYAIKNGYTLSIEGGGSDQGIKNVLSGKSDIGMVNRPLTNEEKASLDYTTIGYDATAFIVHKSNPVNGITRGQLIDIYKGKITNWSQIGGNNRPIILISKKPDRGTMRIIEEETGLFHPSNPKNNDETKKISRKTWDSGSNNDAIVWVGGLFDAIGFVSFGSAVSNIQDGMPIKILAYEGVMPSEQTIFSKRYPIVRELNIIYTKNNPKAKKFASFILSETGQQAVSHTNYIRIDHGK